MNVLEKLKGKLIVSCQAAENEPLHGSVYMKKMAQAAIEGGAAGIRANGIEDIKAIREITDLPIIGINKVISNDTDVIITPTFADVVKLVEAGSTIVALDATDRKRADGTYGYELIRKIKKDLDILVMADVSTFIEGKQAFEAGADIVGPTLSGYTEYSPQNDTPDFDLIEKLSKELPIPIIAEGKIWTREEALQAIQAGAYAVVVGTAISRPQLITKRFVDYLKNHNME